MSDRAWLASVCASELGTMLVFSNFSAPRLGTSSDGKWIFAFGLLGLFALAGPLAVGFADARVAPHGATRDTAT
jgi:hypothetical protein